MPMDTEAHRIAQRGAREEDLVAERAQRTMARAIERARERLARGVYTEADAADLQARLTAAEEAFERLTCCLNALAEERPSLAVEAWHNVDALFAAAYAIGGLSEVSDTADQLVVNEETRFRRTATMRKEKQIEAEPRQAALEKAILNCVDGDATRLSSYRDKMVPSRDAVREILPQFLPSFDPTKTWPAIETLRRAIPGIKKRALPQEN